ncbi:MAG TPA: thiolase family protein [Acetobacteraceae bacterium]|nr:thiolase family protein [Acetobacteraceae bacterium]
MAYRVRTGVIGVAVMPRVNGDAQSLEELQYAATRRALDDAGITIEEIDGIVLGANDQYDGRAISIMMASGPVGGVDRDILSTPSAGEHAFVMGALRVASGLYRTQLVLAWSPTEASSLPEVQRLGADPYFNRRLPLDEMAAHAMQANVLLAEMPGVDELAREIVRKNRENGAAAYPGHAGSGGGFARWPLTEEMTGAPVTGIVALVLASEDFVQEHGKQAAWIAGMGWATEPSFLGDRDLRRVPALDAASEQAYGEAGIADPMADFDVAEVADATPYQELLAYEGLKLASRQAWREHVTNGTFARDGKLPVNLSGGAIANNPVYCTGLMRIAEIARQVLGRAGAHQKQGVSTGLAHAASGDAMQYNTVVVLRNGGNEGVRQ